MRTRDRIIAISALALAIGLVPALGFDGPRPPGELLPSRAREVDPPRPPGSVPRAAPVAVPVAPLPRPAPVPPAQAAVPALTAPVPALGPPRDPPIEPPTTAPAFAAPSMPITPFEAFRSGTNSLRQGDKVTALRSLEYAADRGLTVARWKLARMYQDGEGVDQSDLRAFEYFSSIVDARADDPRTAPDASFVSSAFVALGSYYRTGIPDTNVKADPQRARRTYYHAATYFADPEAQYHYARMLYDGTGGPKDFRRAAQWFNSAANKGQFKAQAMLGRILFKGETGVPRQPSRGLMWLAVARANAPATETWISELYDAALKQATEDERGSAAEMLMQWMNAPRRDQ